MRNNGYQHYFDNEVLAANPLRLIEMLYGGALDSIADARRHLRSKNIPARARAINKAFRIVAELSRCLNHAAGGDFSLRLAGLYNYILRLLVEANTRQSEALLAEAETLLSTLSVAWKDCNPPPGESEFAPSGLVRPDVYVVSDSSRSGALR
jgi:flagellar secretion chaperone FliS